MRSNTHPSIFKTITELSITKLFLSALLLTLLCSSVSSLLDLPSLLGLPSLGLSNSAYAENVTFSVEAAGNLSLTIKDGNNSNAVVPSNGELTLDMAPSSMGTFNSQDITINVQTNNDDGYSLTMLANNSDLRRTSAISSTGTVPVIPSIASNSNGNGGSSGSNTGYTVAQFTALSNDETYGSNGTHSEIYTNTINHWAYKRTTSILNSTNYLPIPTTATRIDYCDATNIANGDCHSNGQDTTVTLGVKLDNNTPAGTYSTTLVFIATANINTTIDCPAGAICYNSNGALASSTTEHPSMGNQTIATITEDESTGSSVYTLTNDTATLWASNFKNPTYGFAGWNTKPDKTGTSYGPNQSITMDDINTIKGEQDIQDITTTGLTLYAMWIPSAGNLQDWTGCPNLAIGSVTALTDERDSNTYAIAKLKDGNCWMIENLRLDNTPALTTANTNNPLTNGSGNNVLLTNSIDQDTGAILSSSNKLSTSSNSWCTSQTANCYNQSMLNTNNTTNTVANMTSANQNVYSYGNYYNWYSATAGYGTYDTVITVDGTEYNPSVGNTTMPGDICPAGWHLPIGASTTTSGSFSQLDRAMGGTGVYQNNAAGTAASQRWRAYPNNFLYSGNWNGPSSYYSGSNGRYWSSTASSNVHAYGLNFLASETYSGTNNGLKYIGRSVRCVANS